MNKCENCQTDLIRKQKKWCSVKCKHAVSNFKHQNYLSQQQKGKSRKQNLINLKGGGCEICGYNRSIAALCFHHLNPSDKLFSLDLRNLSNKKMEHIMLEAAKCQLLCANCHMEIHHGLN